MCGGGRKCLVPPLNPVPVQHAFQTLGEDMCELPTTSQDNRYVVVFQDFLTKWPFVFPVPDQKAMLIARLLAEEITIKAAQSKHRAAYDRKVRPSHFQLGDWVLVHYPHEDGRKENSLDHGMVPIVL